MTCQDAGKFCQQFSFEVVQFDQLAIHFLISAETNALLATGCHPSAGFMRLDVAPYRFLVETCQICNQGIGQPFRLWGIGATLLIPLVLRCLEGHVIQLLTYVQQLVPADHLQHQISIGASRKGETVFATCDLKLKKSLPNIKKILVNCCHGSPQNVSLQSYQVSSGSV